MDKPLPRRQFLKTAGAAATIPLGWSAAARAAAASPDPSKQARLFPGCCAYSFRKYLADGRMTMEDFILKAVELGLHGVDVTTYWLKSTEPVYLASLRHLAFKNGVCFSGAAISTEMCQPDPAKRDTEIEKIRRWVDSTELLGASHLRVFGGDLPPGATIDQGIAWVVGVFKPAAEYAAKKGITLGMEDHGGITGRSGPILEILRRVDSPYAGVNLDISNFTVQSDEEQYREIEACVPYATHTHIRDVFSETKRPIDLERVWQIFAKGGYRGFMSAEYEGEEDAMIGAPKLLAKIKTLCQKYSTA